MRNSVMCLAFLSLGHVSLAQAPDTMLSNLTRPQDYVLKRISSFDERGGNADRRQIPPGQTLVLADQAGPGTISHIWITISSPEPQHLKKLVDYFLGAWDFGDRAFAYGLFGAPVKGEERAGSRSSVYRFHLDSPIPFTKSLRATIEHGHANHRSDNFFSVAYWYQTEPHAAFPPLPAVDLRLPRLYPVGGPGAGTEPHPRAPHVPLPGRGSRPRSSCAGDAQDRRGDLKNGLGVESTR